MSKGPTAPFSVCPQHKYPILTGLWQVACFISEHKHFLLTLVYLSCFYKSNRCGLTLPESTFRRFLPLIDYQRYLDYTINIFITGSMRIKYCPGVNCTNAIELHVAKSDSSLPSPSGSSSASSLAPGGSTAGHDVQCNCGLQFCFDCLLVCSSQIFFLVFQFGYVVIIFLWHICMFVFAFRTLIDQLHAK